MSLKHLFAPSKPKRFRLLIIGKSGCGKTTILSKVCGENMIDVPSTARGSHNIDKEICFEKNDMIVAHDSEGFEAGQSNEFEVVKRFISRRAQARDVNDRLHMVWYCVEMNSRPIQHAEREFFAVLWKVPVLAIVTKFDTFVQDELQELEEAAEEEGKDIDEEELEAQAKEEAQKKFDEHYKEPLMTLPYPPKAVLALSETHRSTPNDSRLAQLVQETMKVFHDQPSVLHHQLKTLFASAQKADVGTKVETSVQVGLIDNYANFDLTAPRSINRAGLVNVWNTSWSEASSPGRFDTGIPLGFYYLKQLVSAIKRLVDDNPRTIGNPPSLELREVRELTPARRKFCRCAQMVADTTIVMKQVFLLPIDDEDVLEDLLKLYSSSAASVYIRNEVIKVHGLSERQGGIPLDEPSTLFKRLYKIVENCPEDFIDV